jgi:hypothetical protein
MNKESGIEVSRTDALNLTQGSFTPVHSASGHPLTHWGTTPDRLLRFVCGAILA